MGQHPFYTFLKNTDVGREGDATVNINAITRTILTTAQGLTRTKHERPQLPFPLCDGTEPR